MDSPSSDMDRENNAEGCGALVESLCATSPDFIDKMSGLYLDEKTK